MEIKVPFGGQTLLIDVSADMIEQELEARGKRIIDDTPVEGTEAISLTLRMCDIVRRTANITQQNDGSVRIYSPLKLFKSALEDCGYTIVKKGVK